MAVKLTIGFLGAGKMATALSKGFIFAGLVKANPIIASTLVKNISLHRRLAGEALDC